VTGERTAPSPGPRARPASRLPAGVETHRAWLKTPVLPGLVGALGSILLLATPEKSFSRLAPLLVLFATILFMVQGLLARGAAGGTPTGAVTSPAVEPDAAALPRRRWLVAVFLQLGVAVYGGYFGAGIGILMLALLGFLGIADIHAANDARTFGACINGIAAGYFRPGVLGPTLLLAVGAIAGVLRRPPRPASAEPTPAGRWC
jgi:uncharacterized membrane protein YfcA